MNDVALSLRRVRFAVAGIVLLPATFLSILPAEAEVRWKNGAISAPARMEPAELGRAMAELARRPAERRVVIHFDGPLQPDNRAALEASGVRLLSYLGGYAYFATLTPRLDAAGAAAVPGTKAIEPIEPLNKLHPDLAAGIARPWSIVSDPDESLAVPRVAVYVLFHRDVDLASFSETTIESYGGTVASEIKAVNGVVAHLSLDRVADLAADDRVMYVEPPLPLLEELNDDARARVGQAEVLSIPYNLDGGGVTVMVYDGGTVASHTDLADRLTIGTSDTSGVSDHATHVACTIGGDGSDGGGQYAGMAPAVDFVSYGFQQEGGLSQGFLYTDPGDIEADYGEAIALHDADLSNNSIGTNTASNGFPCEWEGNYGVTGALIDEIARGFFGDPFRIVWANGNERSGSANCGSTYHTTAPPACAKNHVTVGALNSNDDSVTSFTSWGPCDDGRMKPDVSAPGCQSNDDNGLTSCSSSGGYNVKCGTSMASPSTAGVSALLLEQFRESFPGRPDFRNSTLRALLAHTATDLGNPGPDYQTGYGSIRVKPAADTIIAEHFFEDELTQGQIFAFTLNVGLIGGSGLEVTLAWDDPAGTPDVNPVLVNDLDLRVLGPDETVYFPWTLDPDNPGQPAVQTVKDGVNNIEQVQIPDAGPGNYLVLVEGFNIAEGPLQSFSVVTNRDPQFCTSEPTFGGLQSATPGSSCGEIDLSWLAAQSNCPFGQVSYNVYRSETPGFTPDASNLVWQGLSGTSFTDFLLEPGVTYHYIVRADDGSSGEDTNLAEVSATSPVTPDTVAPIFDGLQSVTAGLECGEVLLDWQAALESCNLPTIYEVHRSTDPGFTPGPGTLVATTFGTSFVDTSVDPGTEHTYLVRAKDGAGNEETNDVRLDVTPIVFDVSLFQTAFEPDDGGWTVIDPNDAEAGNWEWGDPSQTSYQSGDDASDPGVNCWITGLAGGQGNGDVDNGTTTLLSALYDLSGATNPGVGYYQWFTNDRGGSPGDPTDTFRVDVSNDDGQNWTPLDETGEGTPLAWVPVSLALPIAGTSEMRFRFTAADLGDGSLVEAGVDEFQLIDVGQGCEICTEPPVQTLCTLSVIQDGDDVRVDWSTNPVDTRAVVYHVTGCDAGDHLKLGSSDGDFFIHEDAMLSAQPFNYRVTFVDECGNEQAFCGTTDCP